MLKVENLNVIYPGGYRALEGVDLDLKEGKVYGILGPSGSGKSSFLKGILGLAPASGKVSFHGRPIKDFAKKTAYLEQKENIDKTFPITAFQCVLMGTYPALGFLKKPGKAEKVAALEALDRVQMADFKDRQIGELSGGQFQRVLIARALVQNAELIFLDEPFVGLDIQNEATVIQLLKTMAAAGKSVFVVHHNLDTVVDYFDEVILINKTLIANGPVDEVFTKNNIARTYDMFSEHINF